MGNQIDAAMQVYSARAIVSGGKSGLQRARGQWRKAWIGITASTVIARIVNKVVRYFFCCYYSVLLLKEPLFKEQILMSGMMLGTTSLPRCALVGGSVPIFVDTDRLSFR